MPPRPAPSAARVTSPRFKTVADLVERLGEVPIERIRMTPLPGTATEADLNTPEGALCELIDGTLVEKAMGSLEGFLGARLGRLLGNHVEADGLGVILGGDGEIRLKQGLVRKPDVTFIPWESFPGGEFPDEAFWTVAPGLVVEVLSPTNTAKEIDRKLAEFFAAGCKLAWVIDPPTRTAKVYTSAKRFKVLDETGVLDGGRVLPGFTLPLADLFARPTKPKRKGR
jgi:Uma2 family endonuclease